MATTQIPSIQAHRRDKTGSRYAARLRKQDRLPAVIYGHKQEPLHISLDRLEFTDLLQNHAHLIEVAIDAATEPCLVKELQYDHLGTNVIHVDLTRVDLNELVTVEVEMVFVGQAVGLKQEGALMEHPAHTIEVECKATDIPDSIRVDVSGLTVDHPLTVADLRLPEGVRAVTDPEVVVAVITIQAELTEEAPAAAEGAEPEVIGRAEEEEAKE